MPKMNERKPGRPKGAATQANTVGKKRAMRYFDLTLDDVLRPTAAAKQVAEEFSSTAADVFKAKKRHEPALAKETIAEAIEIERKYAEMQAILEMGPHRLRGRAGCLHLLAEAIKGNAI